MNVRREVIKGISGHPMSGLWTLEFESGRVGHIESGHGVRTLARVFGATEGAGDLLDCISGQEIVYAEDYGVISSFVPYDDYSGPYIEEGESIEVDW